ncbi:MAG: M20 family metallopeptidase [Spirochaetales bacterium]|nr:M20 family metallopeptidase [Spirochaetales bacterium]
MRKESGSPSGELGALVQPKRLAEDLWRLVCIPSPTGQERDVAMSFAEMLGAAGAEVEVDETLQESPNVIGRLQGSSAGPVLQLAGHLDHIPVDHAEPQRTERIISGRGSADMKCGLAGILEIVRVLKESGCPFPGQILVTAYGLHEAPFGDSRGLLNLIERGIHGEAAIVFEGMRDRAVVMGKGQSIWNINVVREGEVCHELSREPEADRLLETTVRVIERLREKKEELAAAGHGYPLLGPQSLFIGQVHFGDFYNRVPKQAFLQGTWRWHPDRRFQDVRGELGVLLSGIARPENITIEDSWIFVGEAFSIDPEETIVRALRKAYRSVSGMPLELAGSSSILDVNRLVPFAGIPAVSVSLDGERAHADYEYVRLDRMERGCRVALQTALDYLSGEC